MSLLTMPYLDTFPTISSSTSGEKKWPKKQNIVKLRIENPPWVGLECLVGLDRILGLVGSECFLDRNAFTRKGTQVLQGRLSP